MFIGPRKLYKWGPGGSRGSFLKKNRSSMDSEAHVLRLEKKWNEKVADNFFSIGI